MSDKTIVNRLKILLAEKELAEGRRITYRDLSEEAGVSTSIIYNYFNQNIKNYNVDTLAAFCDYFGCDVGEMLVYPPATGQEDAIPALEAMA